MPRMDFNAIVLRATDLFWCLAISDVEDCFEDRCELLDELRALEFRCERLGRGGFYAAVVESQERKARTKERQ
jgi:hypothetical protein